MSTDDAFKQTLVSIPKYGVLHSASAEAAIKAIVRAVDELEAAKPEGKSLVLTLQTPDGRNMLIETIAAMDFGIFMAKGRVENMACAVVAHISTINIFGVYDDKKQSKGRAGFVFEVAESEEGGSSTTKKGNRKAKR